MADTETQVQSTTGVTRPSSGASDIIQAALLEAARIRLEALQAGERMYEDLLRTAQERCDQMVSDARQDAQRIIADAQRQALSIQSATSQEARASEAALEGLRSEMAAMVRSLRQGVLQSVPPQVDDQIRRDSTDRGSIPRWTPPDWMREER